jgi:hypothetical protein
MFLLPTYADCWRRIDCNPAHCAPLHLTQWQPFCRLLRVPMHWPSTCPAYYTHSHWYSPNPTRQPCAALSLSGAGGEALPDEAGHGTGCLWRKEHAWHGELLGISLPTKSVLDWNIIELPMLSEGTRAIRLPRLWVSLPTSYWGSNSHCSAVMINRCRGVVMSSYDAQKCCKTSIAPDRDFTNP